MYHTHRQECNIYWAKYSVESLCGFLDSGNEAVGWCVVTLNQEEKRSCSWNEYCQFYPIPREGGMMPSHQALDNSYCKWQFLPQRFYSLISWCWRGELPRFWFVFTGNNRAVPKSLFPADVSVDICWWLFLFMAIIWTEIKYQRPILFSISLF